VSSPARDDAALTRAMDYAVSHGVTAVSAVSSFWGEYAALRRARTAGTLKIRVAMYDSLEDWRAVLDTLKANGAGDDWVRLAGVKGYVDGSLGSTTALFYEPYNDAPQTRGLLRFPEDSLRAWIGAADSAGLQVAMHAIGERANGLLLDIYDSVAHAHGARDRRFRIEHAQHLRRSDIDRIAASGAIASMQPLHLVDDGDWAEKRIGPERIKTTYAFRSLIDRNAHLGFGSDWWWPRWSRFLASMPPSLGRPGTGKTPKAGYRSRRSPWKRRSAPTPTKMPTRYSPNSTGGCSSRATWLTWC